MEDLVSIHAFEPLSQLYTGSSSFVAAEILQIRSVSTSAPLSWAAVWSSHTVVTKIITGQGEHWSSEARTRRRRKVGGTWAYFCRHPPAAMLMPDKEVCHMRSVSKLLSMWNGNDSISLSPSRHSPRWKSRCFSPSDLPRRPRTCLQKVPRHHFTSKAGCLFPCLLPHPGLRGADSYAGRSPFLYWWWRRCLLWLPV